VDFGGASRDGATLTPAHSRRYVAPELAQALRISTHATVRVRPPLDIWSAGLVLYELFTGRPFFPERYAYTLPQVYVGGLVNPKGMPTPPPPSGLGLTPPVFRVNPLNPNPSG